MQRSPNYPRLYAWILIAGAPLLFATIAVVLGKDAGWDFLNYHWYNPYALLNGRLGFDLAVAHHATYYNPLLDLPLYWITNLGPAWLGGALLGALFGIAVILIGAIAYQVFPCANPYWRLLVAAALALIAAAGGGAFPAIGNTSNDVPVAIGVFAALLILIRNFSALQKVEFNRKVVASVFVAGIFAGMSVGLKLTTAVYAPGLVLAVFICVPGFRNRSVYATALGLGMVLGVIVFAGYWMQRMWTFGANPVFPYFNQLFHSPLLVNGSYRDPSYFPDSALIAWLFPFYFTADSYYVAEWVFRDAHLLTAYVLVPLTLLLMATNRIDRAGIVKPKLALFLFVFASVSYLTWLVLFCVYRYAIPLEMLAPILVACAVMLWPIRRAVQLSLLIVLFVASQAVVKVTLERHVWDQHYVAVSTPILPDAEHSMVLMSGMGPLAFVIPSFPAQIPFLRIDGWLVWKDDHSSGLARLLHQRVAAHQGPLYMMFEVDDRKRAVEAAAEYQLDFAPERCQLLSSNIAEPRILCRLLRRTAAS
jgi:hypothetical protein